MIKPDSITLAVSVVMLLVIMIGMITPTIGNASAATNSINKIQSGLVSSDSFTTGNTAGWTFGGTAALHDYYEDSKDSTLECRRQVAAHGSTTMQLL